MTYVRLLESTSPEEILNDLEIELGLKIDENCLLFLDEVQAAPEVISRLRWFREEMPNFPVIAAGSLLDFVLNEHEFSMPVGRVSYMYITLHEKNYPLKLLNNNTLK